MKITMSIKNKNLTVIGLGYVGLPLALLAAEKGYQVSGVDLDQQKVNLVNKRVTPIEDSFIQEQLKNTSMTATTDYSEVKNANVIVICVPTPVYGNRMPNYSPVKSACKSIVPYLGDGQLVILESTVNPGVCDEIILPLLEKESGLKCGEDFYLAHCPERINPGDKRWTVANIPRVVGGFDRQSLDKAVKFYQSIISAEIKPMGTLKEAEAVKVVENSFRNINIAFVNELAMSFSKLGIDVVNVIEGAATKPFAFMPHYPGCGIGGHCIPVDPYYLINYAKRNGFTPQFLNMACKVNEKMPEYTVSLTKKELKKLKGKIAGTRVTVLGMAYKPDIDDVRESPAFTIVKLLKKSGIQVKSYDPHLNGKSDAATLDEALKNTDAVIIATAHREFKQLTPEQLRDNKINILIDGRNCLNRAEYAASGIIYKGIGR
jgi:nucleotide sugar dehydrogenase